MASIANYFHSRSQLVVDGNFQTGREAERFGRQGLATQLVSWKFQRVLKLADNQKAQQIGMQSGTCSPSRRHLTCQT